MYTRRGIESFITVVTRKTERRIIYISRALVRLANHKTHSLLHAGCFDHRVSYLKTEKKDKKTIFL